MKKYQITFLLIVLSSIQLSGQTVLSFEEALSKTLSNNYDIRLALVDEEVAENSADRGANGYLPSLNANGSYDWTFFGGNQQLVTGDRTLDPNNSYSYQANASLNYVLFDGLGRKYRYQSALGARQLSTLELKGIMESSVLDLSATFYEVARLQQQNASLDSTFQISKQRLLRAEYGEEYGQTTRLDILNAQVDLNTDSINLMTGVQLEENTRRTLNLIMGEAIDAVYEVQDEVQFSDLTAADEAVAASLQNGNIIERAKQIRANAELSIASVKSDWYPELGLNAGYAYRGSDDPNGAFLIGSSNYGPNAGLSLTWALFDGTRKSRLANAKLTAAGSQIQLELAEKQATTQVLNAHGAYTNALEVLRTSEATVITAQDNFDRSQESFRSGLISSVEFRQAQLNLLTADLQVSRSAYTAKNAELELLALMGTLIAE